jgi:metal-sulfur cluster biosynthetic enzyme
MIAAGAHAPASRKTETLTMAVTYDGVIAALKQVLDPELGINIVDLNTFAN